MKKNIAYILGVLLTLIVFPSISFAQDYVKRITVSKKIIGEGDIFISFYNEDYRYFNKQWVGKHPTPYEIFRGTSITVNVEPKYGYQLNFLSVNGVDITEMKKFNLDYNPAVIKAIFGKRGPYSIKKSKRFMGKGEVFLWNNYSGEMIEDDSVLPYGTRIWVEAIPEKGYKFKYYTKNNIVTRKSSFKLDDDTVIRPYFEKINSSEEPYIGKELITISKAISGEGRIVLIDKKSGKLIDSSGKNPKSNTIEMRFLPKKGYKLKSLTITLPIDDPMHHSVDNLTNLETERYMQNGNFKKPFRLPFYTNAIVEVAFVDENAPTTVETIKGSAVRCYPNPAKDFVVVKGLGAKEELKIYSMNGALVLTATANELGQAKLDIKTLHNDFYIIQTKSQSIKLEVKR